MESACGITVGNAWVVDFYGTGEIGRDTRETDRFFGCENLAEGALGELLEDKFLIASEKGKEFVCFTLTVELRCTHITKRKENYDK